jgi:F-type H+-transporting ATPase subunit b
MLKRIWLCLVIGLAMVMPAGRLLAAESAGEHGNVPEYNLLPTSPEEWKLSLYNSVWVLVIFIIMVAILYPTAWRNVLEGLKKREERIRKDIADAEEAHRKAEASLTKYNEQLAAADARARETIAAATTQGEKLATQIRMTAQQEAEEAKERAMRDIDAAKEAAIREVREQAANLSVAIAEKIIRRNLNAADQQDLIRESLQQLQNVGKN